MSSSRSGDKAWVILLTNPSYLGPLLIVNNGMRMVRSKYPVVAIVTSRLSQEARDILQQQGVHVRDIEPLHPLDGTHVLDEAHKRFEDTWAKLRAFELTEYSRVVLMDADMIVRKNMDDLMELDLEVDEIAAAHACACNPLRLKHYPSDWIPENCAHTPMIAPKCLTYPPQFTPSSPRPYGLLNSGLVVLHPSEATAEAIVDYLYTSPEVASFKFPDQDLLSAFFKGRWKPLPYVYNALKPLRNIHPKMWRDEDVRCVHYILDKPWAPGGKDKSGMFGVVHSWWWEQYEQLEKVMNRSDGPLANSDGWKYLSMFVIG